MGALFRILLNGALTAAVFLAVGAILAMFAAGGWPSHEVRENIAIAASSAAALAAFATLISEAD